MQSKTFLITGTTHGIGTVTAREIARRGHRVVMANRHAERGEKIRDALRAETGNPEIHNLRCDLASFQSIRDCVAEYRCSFNGLDVLVNNAALTSIDHRRSDDGFELVFAVNHLGPFLLTLLLLDLLRASTSGRIVNVASRIYKRGVLDLDDINYTGAYPPRAAYARSKLANVLFTLALHRRLQGSSITVNCLHPGVIASNLLPQDRWWLKLVIPIANRFRISVEEGAGTSLYLALSEEVAATSGRYFDEQQRVEPLEPVALDIAQQEALWKRSAEWTGLHGNATTAINP
jgi:NAD(P)-dependent dehydrogenase (short-subunit alcohol dehydrogenase family)